MQKIIDKYPEIISLVQFGSSISGDTYFGSDVDMMIILKKRDKELEEKIQEEFDWEYQLHIHDETEFKESIEKREPLSLSIVHTGKVLKGEAFINTCRPYPPTDYTVKRCMFNSFAALGIGLSDFLYGMWSDATNSFYHAARSSVWAILLQKEVTPPNNKVFALLTDEEMRGLYKEIVEFRNNPFDMEPDYEIKDKLWNNRLDNDFSQLLNKVNLVIKKNYSIIFKKEIVNFFQIMEILRNKYSKPDFYYKKLRG